jgi:hypothetical protein
MITPASAEWVRLAKAYHHVLAQSPSPEAARIDIAAARKNGQLRMRATLREHKAQPGLRLAPGKTPPAAPVVTTPDYSIPLDTVFARFDWERSYANRRDPVTRSLFEYADVVVHRDDVLELWPIDLPRSELEVVQAKVIDLPWSAIPPEPAKTKAFELPPAMPLQIEGRDVTELQWAVMRALIDIRTEDPSKFGATRQSERLKAVQERLRPTPVGKRTLERAQAHLRALCPNWKPRATNRR